MLKLDYESVVELLKLSMVPAGSTLSMMTGRKVTVGIPSLSHVDKRKVQEGLCYPCAALDIAVEKEEETSRQLFFFPEEFVKCTAELVMGTGKTQQGVDEIMLRTVQEVLSQCTDASSEALMEFMGEKIEERIVGFELLLSPDRMEKWLHSGNPGEILWAEWDVEIEDTVVTKMYAWLTGDIFDFGGENSKEEKHREMHVEEGRKANSVVVHEVSFPEFKVRENEVLADRIDKERQRLQDITMEVSVEIGGASCTVKDILELEEGQVLMLDRQAGAPADIVVNGEFVARGDVLVTGEQFAARLTEIVNKRG